MEKKIDIAELLQDCPQGMELNCTLYYNVFFDKICEDDLYPIKCYTIDDGIRNSVDFTKYGEFHTLITSKCVIFPKGKTTWEGFHRPFMDGDVLYTVTGEGEYSICMVDCIIGDMLYTKASCSYNGYFLHICKEQVSIEELVVMRFATEEEKEKLFKAIKDNGYKWNDETKTLDKLAEPYFKIGDEIVKKNSITNSYIVSSVSCDYYGLKLPNNTGVGVLKVDEQDEWELVSHKFDINTLKPFDSRVLVRDSDSEPWRVSFWGCLINNLNGYDYYDTTRGYYKQCIPYENNEHLLGKNDDCQDYYKTWEEL